MSKHSPNEINTSYASESNFGTLKDYLARKIVRPMGYLPTQVVTFAGTNFKLLDNTLVTGKLAVGINSQSVLGGVVGAEVVGSFSTGSLEILLTSEGVALNRVDLRIANTNTPVIDTDNRRLYGLFQVANGTADKANIGAPSSENLRLVLFKYNSADSLTLVDYTGDLEFTVNRLYSEISLPTIRMEGLTPEIEVLQPSSLLRRHLHTTTNLEAGEIITISTGTTSISGAGAVSVHGDNILLPTSANLFKTNNSIQIYRNGILQSLRDDDVVWDSTDSFHFSSVLDSQETILIYAPTSY